MSNQYSTEHELEKLISELYQMAGELQEALEILRTLDKEDGIKEKVKWAKAKAKEWMK